MKNTPPVIHLDQEAAGAIRSFLVENDMQKPIRIDLCFKGCCDPFLELRVDWAKEHDHRIEVEGLVFVISPEIYDLSGDVTIHHVDEKGRKGFRIVPGKPMGEWDGFGVCNVKI